MFGWHHQLSGNGSKHTPGDSDGQGSLVWFSPWGHKVSDITEQLNNNNKMGEKILSNTQQFAKDMKYLITIFVSYLLTRI